MYFLIKYGRASTNSVPLISCGAVSSLQDTANFPALHLKVRIGNAYHNLRFTNLLICVTPSIILVNLKKKIISKPISYIEHILSHHLCNWK